MDELKECPFCGSSNATLDYYEISCPQELGTIVVCNDCGASAKSIVDWNARPIEDALHARITELESVINQLIEAGNTIVFETFEGYKKHGLFDFAPVNTWQILVKDWLVKERER